MLYLVSGYEERVEEVIESRVTRWSPWMDVRDVWMDDSGHEWAWSTWLGVRKDVWCTSRCAGRRQARGQALDRVVTGARTRGDERADARADARHVTRTCVHACTPKNMRGARRALALMGAGTPAR
ncbi:hypothetical protein CRG98_028832 [Punica granatum]|uniref:Uncharacterized protein n=1 Tax=Punica granatum TaxID=22663 RepID=A0A2I0J3G8_PUNGR|nr:hypothetical protein CRG98_028832 [Punica granatum]